MQLIIGNRNYSSWSLRAGLVLRHSGFDFEETVIPLRTDASSAAIQRWSAAGKVPVLVVQDLTIWDSLAICEFLAERNPSLWPDDEHARAVARACAAEMHSGFSGLRGELPMNMRARGAAPQLSAETKADIARIESLWAECRARFGGSGDFLFGQFSIADAMFAPVVSRFTTYNIALGEVASAYCAAVRSDAAMRAWASLAEAEVEAIADIDALVSK
ncbi:MAG: glutathione S-transferase family protein [Pseudomonadota bacterium]